MAAACFFQGFGHNFWGRLARQLRPQPVAGSGPALAGLEFARDSLDEFRSVGIMFRANDRPRAGHALLEGSPKTAGIGRGHREPRHHHAFQKRLPFVGSKIGFARHWFSSLCRRAFARRYDRLKPEFSRRSCLESLPYRQLTAKRTRLRTLPRARYARVHRWFVPFRPLKIASACYI